MNALSGSTYDWIEVVQYSTPEQFMETARNQNAKVVAFELPSDNFPAVSLDDYQFDFSRENIIVAGHESLGVPPSILQHADRVFIEMFGIGHSMNTSQAATIGLYAASKQFRNFNEHQIKK
jgi:tRNA G18 (ribose-2'-O)-methylase SpoU